MDFGRHHHQAGATPIGARRATTTLTASVWLMIAAGALAVGVLGDLPQPVTVAITGLFAAVALVPVAMDAHDRAVLREQADDLLRAGARVHPDSALLTWREAELTSGRNRKTLARSFSRIALELEGRVVPGPVPLSRAAREHVAEIRALSERLGDLERPVTAQGMALVEDLITDGFGSPLYVPERAKALGPTLQRCLAELDDPKAFATCEGRV